MTCRLSILSLQFASSLRSRCLFPRHIPHTYELSRTCTFKLLYDGVGLNQQWIPPPERALLRALHLVCVCVCAADVHMCVVVVCYQSVPFELLFLSVFLLLVFANVDYNTIESISFTTIYMCLFGCGRGKAQLATPGR